MKGSSLQIILKGPLLSRYYLNQEGILKCRRGRNGNQPLNGEWEGRNELRQSYRQQRVRFFLFEHVMLVKSPSTAQIALNIDANHIFDQHNKVVRMDHEDLAFDLDGNRI